MYGLIGKMIAAAGQRDALIAILLEGIADMPGCLSYIVANDPADENAIWITEVWDSERSHHESLSLPAVQQAIARARPMIAGIGVSTTTEPVGGHGLKPVAARGLTNRSMPPGTIIPELAYPDVAMAVDWLCQTFGFRERLRIGSHRCQLVLDGESIVVTASGSAQDGESRPSAAGTHQAIMVRVRDVDSHFDHARQSGARTLGQPQTYPFGERQYTAEDIGGHRWTFSQSIADVPPEDWGGQLVEPARS